MSFDPDDDSRDDSRLNEILARYLQAVEGGESPDHEQLIREHSEYANELREFLADKGHIDEIAEAVELPSDSAASAPVEMPTLPPDRTALDTPTQGYLVAPNKAPRPGTILRYFGDYELIEEIARGGMGVVYKARQVKLNRVVAIKMILAGQLASQEDVQRFYTEAEAAAGLDHPGIVPIFEVGEHEGQHYFSMGFIDGESLASKHADGPLAPREAAELVRAVAQAVQYAHDKGVIHRDLKPANILLDKDGDPKITDFGLAKQIEMESGMTATGQILGTPSYMPPEQAAGRLSEVRETADVYSLGAILYTALTGRPPFQADNPLDTLMQVLEREPVSSRQLNPNVPRDLETICLKCLDKDRRRRYQSAQELDDELRRFLEGRPIKARPIGRPARAWRWCKRNPIVASLILLAACLLMGGTMISTVLAVLATRERDRAERNAVEANLARDEATQARDEARRQELEARRRAYISDINLIQQSLALNKLGQARSLLYAQVPESGQEDERGWEWRYLWQQCRSQSEYKLTQYGNSIRTMCVSHDGRWLAHHAALDQVISVWDLETKQEVKRIPVAKMAIAFSPTEPLLAVVLKSNAPQVLLWNPADGSVIQTLTTRHHTSLLAFSGDGKFLVGNCAGEIIRWRVADWQEVNSRVPAPGLFILEGGAFAVNATGNLAAYGTKNNVVLADLENGKTRWSRYASSDVISALAFSPDGKMLASAASFNESDIRLWDVETGAETGRLIGHRASVRDLVFWPGENQLISASDDQSIRVWDVTQPEQPITLLTLRGHNGNVWQLAPLPDQRTLISGGKDGEILAWDLERVVGMDPRRILPRRVQNWSFASEGDAIVTVDDTGQVERWREPNYQESELLFELGGTAETRSMGPRHTSCGACFSQDGRLLATCLTTGKIAVWDVDRRELRFELPTGEVNAKPSLFVGQAEKLLVSCQRPPSVHVWNLVSGTEERHSGLRYIRFGTWEHTPDEQMLLGLLQTGQVQLRDDREGQLKSFTIDAGRAVDGAFSPDGSLFAIASQFGYVKIWRAESFQEVAEFNGFLTGVHSVAFTPDGSRLVAGSAGFEAVKLLDVRSQRELLNLEGQGSIVYQMKFSKDGSILGARPRDGALHVWRVPSWEEIEAAEAKAKTTEAAKHNAAPSILTLNDSVSEGLSAETAAFYVRLASTQPRESAIASYKKAAQLLAEIPPKQRTIVDWGYLGQSLYYTEKWEEAGLALETNIRLRGDDGPTLSSGPRWWYLIMTLARLGEKDKATAHYERLVEAMKERPPHNVRLHERLRSEAAELLGIENPRKRINKSPKVKGDDSPRGIQAHDSASSRPARWGKASFALGLISLAACAVQAGVCAQQEDPVELRNYADGPLTAKDFRAPIPGFMKFRGQKALTTTDFRYDIQYRLYRSRRRATARLSSIDVRAVAIPSKSWNRQPNNSRLLDHEQGHFDLTYIAVLRARLDFSTSTNLAGGGANDEQAIKDLRQQLERRFRLLTEELSAAHVEYDEITRHGMDFGPQEEQRNHQKQQIETLTKRLKSARF